jgi:hypothetical protein
MLYPPPHVPLNPFPGPCCLQLAQDGFTPLHAAASVGNLHAIELLLNVEDAPADVFAVDLQVPSRPTFSHTG